MLGTVWMKHWLLPSYNGFFFDLLHSAMNSKKPPRGLGGVKKKWSQKGLVCKRSREHTRAGVLGRVPARWPPRWRAWWWQHSCSRLPAAPRSLPGPWCRCRCWAGPQSAWEWSHQWLHHPTTWRQRKRALETYCTTEHKAKLRHTAFTL